MTAFAGISGEECLHLPNAKCWPVNISKAPAVDASKRQVLMSVTQMRQLPIQHGGKATGVDHDVAHPKIAVKQDSVYRCGQMILQPSEREGHDRAIAAEEEKACFEVRQQARCPCLRQSWQRVPRHGVNGRQLAGKVIKQRWLRTSQYLCRVNLGLDSAHHISGAKIIYGLDLGDYFRCLYAGHKRRTHNRSFNVMAINATGHHLSRGGTAKYVAMPCKVE